MIAISLLLALQQPLDATQIPSREVAVHDTKVQGVAFGAAGKRFFTMTEDRALHAWEMKDFERRWSEAGNGGGAIPGGGTTVFLGAGEETIAYSFLLATVTAHSAEDGSRIGAVGGPNFLDRPTCIAVDPKDRWVWLGTTGKLARLKPEDVQSWSTRGLGNGGTTCLAIDSKAKLMAAGGTDHSIRFVNPTSANVDDKKLFEGHGASVTALAFDSKSKLLASGDEGGKVRVWTVSNGKVKLELEAGGVATAQLAFDPKGKWLAAGSVAGGLLLWDLKTGEVLASLGGDAQDPILGMAFVDKGAGLLVFAGGKAGILWDLSEL